MIYKKATLSIEDITNLYLYGTLTIPTNLVNESLIRPAYNENTPQFATVEIPDCLHDNRCWSICLWPESPDYDVIYE